MNILIEKYNPQWKVQFEALRDYLYQHLKNEILAIEHVGSTSVPGLSAKPIIDLDIIIEKDSATLTMVIEKLKDLGYRHSGDRGITGREAFERLSDKIPITKSGKSWFEHHLYVCEKGNVALRNHLALKRHLIANPGKVVEYSKLKMELAMKFPDDIDAYVDGKTEFILDILKNEGMKSVEIDLIEDQNRLK